MHPTIFLDFDGVINNDEYPIDQGPIRIYFDSRLIEKLNNIIRQSGAKLVISSDWRRGRSIAELQDLLESYDCIGEVIDKTPELEDFHNQWVPITRLEEERIKEIRQWLRVNGWPMPWVAIDDLDLSDLTWFVQTDPRTGITDNNVNVAVKMLTDPIRGKHD